MLTSNTADFIPAVADSRNIAPTGWHVASDAEWTTLTTYLGGENVAGGKLKEAGTLNWSSPNIAATNETGFSALPGGYRSSVWGSFDTVGGYGVWWSASENYGDGAGAWSRYMEDYLSSVYRYNDNKANGFSVRCVRDF